MRRERKAPIKKAEFCRDYKNNVVEQTEKIERGAEVIPWKMPQILPTAPLGCGSVNKLTISV
jgi:hypothetical protein